MDDPIDDVFLGKHDDYKFFRNFMNAEEAQSFAALLEEARIPHRLETTGTVIDSVFVGEGLVPKAIIKVLPADFTRINKLLADQLNELDHAEVEEHYLAQLDNGELREILEQQDQWSAEDVTIARILLEERGEDVSKEEVQALRQERFAQLRAGRAGSTFWMFFYAAGIIFGLFVSLILVIAGIGMAYYYAHGKSNDPDGNSYYVFDVRTRKLGKIMLYGAGVLLIVVIVVFRTGLYYAYQ